MAACDGQKVIINRNLKQNEKVKTRHGPVVARCITVIKHHNVRTFKVFY